MKGEEARAGCADCLLSTLDRNRPLKYTCNAIKSPNFGKLMNADDCCNYYDGLFRQDKPHPSDLSP